MNMKEVQKNVDQAWAIVDQSPSPEAYCLDFGMKLMEGIFGEEGKIFAASFFEFGANRGNADCMYNLAVCYRWGDGGVYADVDEAMKWFRKAAEKGHKEAEGVIEKFDTPEGRSIIQLSAMHGVAGPGTKWYKTKIGVEYYISHAEQGDAECQYELARQYANERNFGPFKFDVEKAIYWYTKAAENGVVDAMFNLAAIYRFGTSASEPDLEKAKEWYKKCADAGDEEAKQILLKLEQENQ